MDHVAPSVALDVLGESELMVVDVFPAIVVACDDDRDLSRAADRRDRRRPRMTDDCGRARDQGGLLRSGGVLESVRRDRRDRLAVLDHA